MVHDVKPGETLLYKVGRGWAAGEVVRFENGNFQIRTKKGAMVLRKPEALRRPVFSVNPFPAPSEGENTNGH